MKSDCVEVDELIVQLTDYKNDYTDMAAEKLLRKCSRSWEAYQYLQERVHDTWLPDSARQQLRRIINRIRMRTHQQHEYGWAYKQS
jgi:flagellar biosynthesis chaperone FliJ